MILLLIGVVVLKPRTPAPMEKITIAEGSQPIAGPVYIAFHNGYFKDEGLDVTLQSYASGKDCLNAVMEGTANLGTVAETPIVFASLKGAKIYTIATIHNSGKNTAIVARKDRGISKAIDLKNKKVGVTKGTNGEYLLDIFLSFHNILKAEVAQFYLKPSDMVEALMKGEVDAVVTWNPHVIQLQKTLGENGVTFISEEIYTETYSIVGMRDFIKSNPEKAKKVLRSLVRAENFIRKNPVESQKVIANRIKMDRKLLRELWSIYNFTVTLEQPFLMTLEGQARWAIKNRLTDRRAIPNFRDLIYLDGLKEIHPDGMTIIH